MVTIRKAAARGHAQHGWLESYHSFSFADYHDPDHMGFRALRVINEDRVRAGSGFPTHSHRDMEILSYVLEGALEHRDSIGTGSIIRPGDMQRMSAGRGVSHSEFNASKSEPVHFLQIWLVPTVRGIEPGYEQKAFAPAELAAGLRPVASPDGRDGSLTVHTDATVLCATLRPGQSVEHALAPGRHAWVQVARGALRLGDTALEAGDGAAVSGEAAVRLVASDAAEVLVFDLA